MFTTSGSIVRQSFLAKHCYGLPNNCYIITFLKHTETLAFICSVFSAHFVNSSQSPALTTPTLTPTPTLTQVYDCGKFPTLDESCTWKERDVVNE